MIDLVNLQRKIQIDLSRYREFCSFITSELQEAAQSTFSVAFISDRRMKQLNEMFRGINSTTDVLSFPHVADEFELSTANLQPRADFLGDIVISAAQAQKQAGENGLTLENEIKQLILHGLLHLCGFDHETDDGQMNTRELDLRNLFGI